MSVVITSSPTASESTTSPILRQTDTSILSKAEGLQSPDISHMLDTPLRQYDDEDAELELWKKKSTEIQCLQEALAVQHDISTSYKEGVDIVRLIMHYLQVRGKTDLIGIITKEALHHNMHLLQNPDLIIGGSDKGTTEATELHQLYTNALYYLPALSNVWHNAKPWPTKNYRKDVIPLKGLPQCHDNARLKKHYTLYNLIDHLFLDEANARDIPYKLPIRDNFTNAFFYTHTEFVSPDVLVTLIGRFYLSIPDAFLYPEKCTATRLRVLDVLTHWIKHAVVDFSDRLLRKCRAFAVLVCSKVDKSTAPPVKEAAEKLLRTVEKCISMGTPRVSKPLRVSQAHHEQPEPKMDGLVPGAVLSTIGGLDDEEVARQLCLLCHSDFEKISIREWFNSAWVRGSELWSLSYNLRSVVDRVGAFVEWVTSLIVMQPTNSQRISQLRQFIRVGYLCSQFNCLLAAQAIFAGAISKCVRRIPGFDTALSNKPVNGQTSEVEMAARLDEISDPWRANVHRKVLEECVASDVPCVPILAYTNSNFTTASLLGNSIEVIDNGTERTELVNWQKMMAMANQAIPIVILQSRPYNFRPLPQIQKMLNDLPGKMPEAVLDAEIRRIEVPLPPSPPVVLQEARVEPDVPSVVSEGRKMSFWRRLIKRKSKDHSDTGR
eukprot:TRINITY_DN33494_c0_g1_i1.p1 TRINITY_DN33494_c0_g1~~TRINITY_DN33494_c0_g1_i1.p1  ORF type:complete len:696 (+),score=223.00 TRINITY_DN33494_c0_g1_i1:101-2089(+)